MAPETVIPASDERAALVRLVDIPNALCDLLQSPRTNRTPRR